MKKIPECACQVADAAAHEGSGVALGKRLQDMVSPLLNRKPRDLMDTVAAGTVPPLELVTHVHRFGECLIALGVVRVDSLPWRQDEDEPVERIRSEQALQILHRERIDLLKQGECIEDTAIEEDPLRAGCNAHVLLNVSSQDLSREGWQLWPGAQATGDPFSDDRPGRFANSGISTPAKFG
jgi:hypothetical protein